MVEEVDEVEIHGGEDTEAIVVEEVEASAVEEGEVSRVRVFSLKVSA